MAYIHWMIPGDLLQEVKVSERDGKHCMEDLEMMSEILVYNEYEMEAILLPKSRITYVLNLLVSQSAILTRTIISKALHNSTPTPPYFLTGNFLPNHSAMHSTTSPGFSYKTQCPASTTLSSKSPSNPCSFAFPI
jgi:hypothetical protein